MKFRCVKAVWKDNLTQLLYHCSLNVACSGISIWSTCRWLYRVRAKIHLAHTLFLRLISETSRKDQETGQLWSDLFLHVSSQLLMLGQTFWARNFPPKTIAVQAAVIANAPCYVWPIFPVTAFSSLVHFPGPAWLLAWVLWQLQCLLGCGAQWAPAEGFTRRSGQRGVPVPACCVLAEGQPLRSNSCSQGLWSILDCHTLKLK